MLIAYPVTGMLREAANRNHPPSGPPKEERSASSDFFESCGGNLVPQGRVSLQFIGGIVVASDEVAQNPPALLFPVSKLFRIQEVLAASYRRFHVMQPKNASDGHEQTLRIWLSRLLDQKESRYATQRKDPVREYVCAPFRFVPEFETGTLGLYCVALLCQERGQPNPTMGPECQRNT